jgi:hypothetical protein
MTVLKLFVMTADLQSCVIPAIEQGAIAAALYISVLEGCHKATCEDCATPTQGAWWCLSCDITFCPDCRLNEYCNKGDEFCFNCRGIVEREIEIESPGGHWREHESIRGYRGVGIIRNGF